jgi:hypothetical protein
MTSAGDEKRHKSTMASEFAEIHATSILNPLVQGAQFDLARNPHRRWAWCRLLAGSLQLSDFGYPESTTCGDYRIRNQLLSRWAR